MWSWGRPGGREGGREQNECPRWREKGREGRKGTKFGGRKHHTPRTGKSLLDWFFGVVLPFENLHGHAPIHPKIQEISLVRRLEFFLDFLPAQSGRREGGREGGLVDRRPTHQTDKAGQGKMKEV